MTAIKFLDADAVDAIHMATIKDQAAEIAGLCAEIVTLREALEQCKVLEVPISSIGGLDEELKEPSALPP